MDRGIRMDAGILQDDVTHIKAGTSAAGMMGFRTVMEDTAEEYGIDRIGRSGKNL